MGQRGGARRLHAGQVRLPRRRGRSRGRPALAGEPALDAADARGGWRSRRRPGLVRGLARAAVRELWEETGLMLGLPGPAARGARGAGVAGAGSTPRGCVPERRGAALRLPRDHAAGAAAALRRALLPGRGDGASPATTSTASGERARAPAVARPRRRAGAAAAVHHRGGAVGGRGAARRSRTRRGRCPSSTRRAEGPRFSLL